MIYPIVGRYLLQKQGQTKDLPIHIYYLCDPADGQPRYVGRTFEPGARVRAHVRNQMRTGQLKDWIDNIKRQGRTIEMNVVEIVAASEGPEAEGRWIRRMWTDGFPLLNTNHLSAHRFVIPERARRFLEQEKP